MRILKYALYNIGRNTFLSLSSILVLSLIIFFINILFLVNYTTDFIVGIINNKLTISITLKQGYTDADSQVVELTSELRSLGGKLAVTYISPEEGLSTVKIRDPELIRLVESEGENPLPAIVKVDNIGLSQYDTINDVVMKYKSVVVYDNKFKKKIIDYKAQYEKIISVIKVLSFIKIGVFLIIFFFVFSVFVIIYNIIGNFVFFHRDEIKITKLVGGDDRYIYGPFSLQGLIYTIIATGLSFFAFTYLIGIADSYLKEYFPGFVSAFLNATGDSFRYEFLGLAFIGLVSGFLSSRRFISKSSMR